MNSFEARFSGIGRLISVPGLRRLQQAHVAIIGLGGVGSWTAEALARSGLGRLTLVDLDDVCISNTNRQLHAWHGTFGQAKVDVLAERIRLINPECAVNPIRSFFLPSNADELLAPSFDFVVDAIDSPSRKSLLISKCRARGIPVVTTGAAGGRRDPTAVRVIDLALSSHDRLLQEVRRLLRKRHGFPRGEVPFEVPCVCSPEPPVFPQKDGTICAQPGDELDLRLDCQSGYGTACFVTGAFGFAAAACVVQRLAAQAESAPEHDAVLCR
ncbi:MAG: tRNA threonylcarbamoyladenosine dehydratase [Verrucomicrobiota bacterium]